MSIIAKVIFFSRKYICIVKESLEWNKWPLEIHLLLQTIKSRLFLLGEVELQKVQQRSKQKTVIQENMAILVK